MTDLVKKYNVSGPRYTSYPAVPYWQETPPAEAEWKSRLIKTVKSTNQTEGISLYIHFPYCEALCTYCGCNKKISRSHHVEEPYIDLLRKEWLMYLSALPEKPVLREIHLGGGTPTFFSPKNLERILKVIIETSDIHEDYEFSFEGHPGNTTYEHLKTLANLGFSRVSFGVQDLSETVQKAIGRIQPYSEVKKVTEDARELGYQSINFDLIYGLPFQNEADVRSTIEQISTLKPDRIAFYGYAHVPWKSKAQRLFTEKDLPQGPEKRNLYETGKNLLLKYGYADLGMDHFALPHDKMYQFHQNGKLHRNFMGYTTNNTKALIGLGVSSISDGGNVYIQNSRSLHEYKERINNNHFAIEKGHLLSDEDVAIRKHINDLMCHSKTSFRETLKSINIPESAFRILEEMERDGLLVLLKGGVILSDEGKAFVRNVCMALDRYISPVKNKQFSKVI